MNDIADDILSECFLFAHDLLLMDRVIFTVRRSYDLDAISAWRDLWFVTIDAKKLKGFFPEKYRNLVIVFLTNELIVMVDQHDRLARQCFLTTQPC